MKRTEFSYEPPKYEIAKVALHDGDYIIRFYDNVQTETGADGEMKYVCDSYEMVIHTMAGDKAEEAIAARVDRAYDKWLASAIKQDGGLDAIKREKIALSKKMLSDYVASHPITSAAHGGVPGVYSITEDKQNLMASQYISYQAEKAVNPDAVLTWNETGRACEVWTEAEFIQLVIEIKARIAPLVSYQQKIEEKIASAETIEDIEAVVIDYDAVM